MSVSSDDVRRQLDRLLRSPVFANAGRMSRFLKFVVERTLAGEAERLKEYVIGIEVFDRDADYDPRLDSIVRVEAARLRSKLAEYYGGEGRGDAVILSLPKGGYAPIIKVEQRPAAGNGAAANGTALLETPNAIGDRSAGASVEPNRNTGTYGAARFGSTRAWALGSVIAAAAIAAAFVAWSPGSTRAPALRIAVMPFAPDGQGTGDIALAQQVTEGVTAELVRDGRFSVVSSSAARAEYSVTRRPREVAASLGADIVVEARISNDGQRIRVEARAALGRTEEKLWVHGFAGDSAETDALESEIAAALVAALGDLGPLRE